MTDVPGRMSSYSDGLHDFANEIRAYAEGHLPRPARDAVKNIAVQVGLSALALGGVAREFESMGDRSTNREGR